MTNLLSPLITFKAVGDIIPGTNFPDNRLIDPDRQRLFRAVKAYLQGADILFGNFESTLTNYPYSAKDMSRRLVFAFRTPPSYAQLLKETGFDVLSVANNHSMDFFPTGFADTLKHIQGAGMQYTGQKNQILYLDVKGVAIAFIGFSHLDVHNSVNDLTAAKALVAKAKQKAQIVVISVHGGAEGEGAVHVRNQQEFFYGENRGNLVAFAHTLIDQGADLILGHGPHVPRALELYQGRLIAYSLGNFLGYRTLSSAGLTGHSLILQARLNTEGKFVSGEIIPILLNGDSVPYFDPRYRSVDVIRRLTKTDFPQTPLIIGKKGQILPLPKPAHASSKTSP